MQFQNSLFAVTSDHDETLEHCRVQSSIAEATSWLTYHFCFSVVFKLRYCLVAVSCLFVCFNAWIYHFSYWVVIIVSPFSPPILSCRVLLQTVLIHVSSYVFLLFQSICLCFVT